MTVQDFSMFLTFRTSADRRPEMHEATKHESMGMSGKSRWIPVVKTGFIGTITVTTHLAGQ